MPKEGLSPALLLVVWALVTISIRALLAADLPGELCCPSHLPALCTPGSGQPAPSLEVPEWAQPADGKGGVEEQAQLGDAAEAPQTGEGISSDEGVGGAAPGKTPGHTASGSCCGLQPPWDRPSASPGEEGNTYQGV